MKTSMLKSVRRLAEVTAFSSNSYTYLCNFRPYYSAMYAPYLPRLIATGYFSYKERDTCQVVSSNHFFIAQPPQTLFIFCYLPF